MSTTSKLKSLLTSVNTRADHACSRRQTQSGRHYQESESPGLERWGDQPRPKDRYVCIVAVAVVPLQRCCELLVATSCSHYEKSDSADKAQIRSTLVTPSVVSVNLPVPPASTLPPRATRSISVRLAFWPPRIAADHMPLLSVYLLCSSRSVHVA